MTQKLRSAKLDKSLTNVSLSCLKILTSLVDNVTYDINQCYASSQKSRNMSMHTDNFFDKTWKVQTPCVMGRSLPILNHLYYKSCR